MFQQPIVNYMSDSRKDLNFSLFCWWNIVDLRPQITIMRKSADILSDIILDIKSFMRKVQCLSCKNNITN